MLKLLLRENRYEIKKEYSFRFLNMLLVFVIISLAINSVLLFGPNAVLLIEKSIVEQDLARIENEQDIADRELLTSYSQSLQQKLDLFNSPYPTNSVFVSEINKNINESISLNAINLNFRNVEDDFLLIEVKGNAQTRDSLVKFAADLRNSEKIETVDLPLSNLTRETDLNFVLNIKTIGLR